MSSLSRTRESPAVSHFTHVPRADQRPLGRYSAAARVAADAVAGAGMREAAQ